MVYKPLKLWYNSTIKWKRKRKMFYYKEKFTNDSEYLRYDGEIVARFKYSKGPFTKAKFKKFLINNKLTVNYYKELRQQGLAPLDVWDKLSPSSYRSTIEAWRNK